MSLAGAAARVAALLFASLAGLLGTTTAWAQGPARSLASPAAAAPPPAPLSGQAAVGKAIFFDRTLSEPPGTSCASCHDPARAFAGDHGSGVGVAAGSRPGVLAKRSTPSLLYLAYVPRLRFYWDDDARGVDPEISGGFFWDGRSDSIAALVRQPLLNPREMNNRDGAQIAMKLARAPYKDTFSREFPGALTDADRTLDALGTALQAYLTSPAMAPFSSRFDDYVRGVASLSAKETEGLRLFKDPTRGNCAHCHTVFDEGGAPERSLFTDFGYEAVGAPRNHRVRAPDEDLGLCERADAQNPTNDPRWCASFRTPSLRNVALRPGLMHNGAFTSLREVVRFYATRGTNPEKWYAQGTRFDDTPAAYRNRVNVKVAPYNRRAGEAPALSDEEIDAIVAFLDALTDRRR